MVKILCLRHRHPADGVRPKVCLQELQMPAATERGGGSSSSRVGWRRQQQRRWMAAAASEKVDGSRSKLVNWSRDEGVVHAYMDQKLVKNNKITSFN